MTILILIALAVFIGYLISIYNRLASLKNQVESSFAQIDVQLKQRYDMIPNLVEVAKGYMKHERETLDAVVQARQQAYAVSSAGMYAADSLMEADSKVTAALTKFLAVAESYPDLKADSLMVDLQEKITSMESRVAFARTHYNDTAQLYNTAQEQFPGNIVAGMSSHRRVPMLQVISAEVERQAPKVSF